MVLNELEGFSISKDIFLKFENCSLFSSLVAEIRAEPLLHIGDGHTLPVGIALHLVPVNAANGEVLALVVRKDES